MKRVKYYSMLVIIILFGTSALFYSQVPQLINYQGKLTENNALIDSTVDLTFTIYDALAGGTELWGETQTNVLVVNGIFNVLLGRVAQFPNHLFFDSGDRYLEIKVGEQVLTPRSQITSVAYSIQAENSRSTSHIRGRYISAVAPTTDQVLKWDGTEWKPGDDQTSTGTVEGDITAVGAGLGLIGGGITADVNLDIGAGNGITVTADAVSLNTTYTDGRYVNSGEANSVTSAMITDNTITSADISTNILSSLDGVSNDGGNIDLIAQGGITITPNNSLNTITISSASSSGDNLGNHTATQNIKLNNHWLSGDGGNEGLFVTNDGNVSVNQALFITNDGNVGIGTNAPSAFLHTYNADNAGVLGSEMGVKYSQSQNLAPAIYGQSVDNSASITYGVLGSALAPSSTYCMGIFGEGGDGISNSYGLYGAAFGTGSYSIAVYGHNMGTASNNYAGYFSGNVHVAGTLSKSAGTFKIDHPLDPENKFLVHSFIESPDMMNVYNGNTITDNSGVSIVDLPSYFEVLNIDFRYQLTCIGEFAQAIVAEEINNNRFTIKTDKPNVKVSWQVTGVRNDEYARAHRVVPEVYKKGVEKGKYIHPELFGKSKNEGFPVRAKKANFNN